MKFPIFASFIVFCAWLAYALHRRRNLDERKVNDFWEKERKANNTRRKSLDNLAYITIPFEKLPMDILCENPDVKEYHETLYALSKEPIVNFTGISNTDLKLLYGAPNINLLSVYDQRYTTLARTLQSFATTLYENGYLSEACSILEFAVSTRTDISATYKLLITVYRELKWEDKIPALLPVAENLNSGIKNSIVKMIQEACQQPD